MGDVLFAGISLEFVILQLLKISRLRVDRKQILVVYDTAQEQRIARSMDLTNLRNEPVIYMPVDDLVSRPLTRLNEYKFFFLLFVGERCEQRCHSINHLFARKDIQCAFFNGVL